MKAAQKLITNKIKNLEIDLEAKTGTGEKVKDIFCANFDGFEKIVEFAEVSVKNPIARWIMKLALLIGNSMQEKYCPKK